MEISDDVMCLFSAEVERQRGSYVLKIPEQEITVGDVTAGDVYQVVMLSTENSEPAESNSGRKQDSTNPPVVEGEHRTVEIEDIGEQGDGIARVERGFVVIVPDTELGEKVTIEITDVSENVSFGEVIGRADYE